MARILEEKVADRELYARITCHSFRLIDNDCSAARVMQNTLIRGAERISKSSGWPCAMISGGPRLSMNGEIQVVSCVFIPTLLLTIYSNGVLRAYGGPDLELTFQQWDPEFYAQLESRWAKYCGDYFSTCHWSTLNGFID